MKVERYANSRECLTRVRKFSNRLKKELYAMFLPHRVMGCATSPSYYIYLLSMDYKDKVIRISNHESCNPFYHTPNVFNVIIKEDVSDEWTQNKINEIQSWIKGGKIQ